MTGKGQITVSQSNEYTGLCGTCHEEMVIGSVVLSRDGEDDMCEACALYLVASPSSWPGSDDPVSEYGDVALELSKALGVPLGRECEEAFVERRHDA